VEPDKVDVTVTEGRAELQRRVEAREDALRQTITARSGPEGAPPMPMAVAKAVPEPVIVNAGEAGVIRTGNVA
jgi:hypothetical protein